MFAYVVLILYICSMRRLNSTYYNYFNDISEFETPENRSLLFNRRRFTNRELLSPTLPQLILSSSKQKPDGNLLWLSMLQFPLLFSIKKYVQCLYLTIRDLSSYLIVTEKIHYYSDNVHLRKFR